jgi:hypothetical protein
MKNLVLCLLIFLLIALISALISCDIDEIFENKCPGTIRGKAVDLNGVIVADADIRTLPETRIVATKRDGTFEIEEVSPKEYTIIGTKGCYNESRRNITVISCKTSEVTIYLGRGCYPPNPPTDPRPADGLGSLPTSLTLRWHCNDPDPGDELRYDVYCGTTNPPYELVASDLKSSFFDKQSLMPNTTYYWQVVAKDNRDSTSKSQVWKFTTSGINPSNRPPNPPSAPNPADGATDQPTSLALSWFCTDPNAGDILKYDVYLDTSTPPSQHVSRDQIDPQFRVNGLKNYTKYFWKVVARDNQGAEASSNVWSFTTGIGIPKDGLALYFPFNGNSNDESGNGYHGTVYGATLSKDGSGNENSAYSFDGVDDYIAVQNFPMLDRTFTYAAWLKVLGTTIHHQSFGAHGEGGAVGETWNFAYNTYHKLWDTYDRRNGPWQVNMEIGTSWTHVAIVYDNTIQRLYVNGVERGRRDISTPVPAGVSNTLRIGTLIPGDQQYQGLIDEVCIYNRALSVPEIQQLYQRK